MKDVLAFLGSSKFFALFLCAAACTLMALKIVPVSQALTLGTALAGLFRVASAIDGHAQAVTDAAAPPPPAPAASPAVASALTALAAALTPPPPAGGAS